MPSSPEGPLYIGFDLSTQQLKGLVVTSDLKVVYLAKFDFDADAKGYDVDKGVQTNEAEREVFAPVAMWLQAFDGVLQRLKDQGLDFGKVKGISGAGQQHGSVYWNERADRILGGLEKGKTLEEQVNKALSHPNGPNWQDASTQKECDEFDAYLGDAATLANVTGSRAHHVRNIHPPVNLLCRKNRSFLLTSFYSGSRALRYCDFNENTLMIIKGPRGYR